MRASLLVAALAGASAWDDCSFPKFDHFAIDEGAGKSWAYTATAMNDKTYLGGYALGHFNLQGVFEADEVPANNAAILLGKTHSKDVTLYVAEVSSAGKMEKAWYFKTDSITASGDKIIVRGLHHSLDREHVIAAGYYSGKMELPDGTMRDAAGRLNYGVEPVPFVAKIDVSQMQGIGPGTTGWVVDIDQLGSTGFPGGAQVYSVDGFANGDVLVSYAGCAQFNSTEGATSPFSGFSYSGGLGCKHYVSKLAAADGTEVWRKEMPASFEQSGTVHDVPVFEEFEPCRVIQDGHFFCAFHLDVNETLEFNQDNYVLPWDAAKHRAGAGREPAIGVAKFNPQGNAVWTKATVVASSVTSMSVNKDGTLLAVAGHDKGGSMRSGGGPALIARIDTSAGKEGNVLWSDAAGYGSHGIRDCVVTWDPMNSIQQVIGFGQISSKTTITDVTGAKTTLNSRGSYEVFIVSYSASDGSGRYAADGGGTGLEYFFELAMDMDSSAIVMAGAVGRSSKTLQWGNVKRENAMYCDESSSPVGEFKSFAIKLKTETELPYCLGSCSDGALDVKAGHCYIDRYCYKHNEVSTYAGLDCFKCDASASQVEWSGPNTTAHCYMAGRAPGSGTCVAKDAFKSSRTGTSECEKCMPEKDPNGYSVIADYRLKDGKCTPITWEDKANEAGWKPCKIKAARLRRLAMKDTTADRRALAVDDKNDD